MLNTSIFYDLITVKIYHTLPTGTYKNISTSSIYSKACPQLPGPPQSWQLTDTLSRSSSISVVFTGMAYLTENTQRTQHKEKTRKNKVQRLAACSQSALQVE